LIAVLSAWLFWKANCDGAAGAVAAMEAQRLNDPLSNKKRAGEAGSSWGCRVGGSLKRSGAAEGREPAGRSPKRRCFSSFWLCLKRGAGESRCRCPDFRDKLSDLAGRWWVKPRWSSLSS